VVSGESGAWWVGQGGIFCLLFLYLRSKIM
jgi:hypothetical protein